MHHGGVPVASSSVVPVSCRSADALRSGIQPEWRAHEERDHMRTNMMDDIQIKFHDDQQHQPAWQLDTAVHPQPQPAVDSPLTSDCRSPSDPRSPTRFRACSPPPPPTSAAPSTIPCTCIRLQSKYTITMDQATSCGLALIENDICRDGVHDSPDVACLYPAQHAQSTPMVVRSLVGANTYELARDADSTNREGVCESLPTNFLQANNLGATALTRSGAIMPINETNANAVGFPPIPRHMNPPSMITYDSMRDTHALLASVLALDGGARLLHRHLCSGSPFRLHSPAPPSATLPTRTIADRINQLKQSQAIDARGSETSAYVVHRFLWCSPDLNLLYIIADTQCPRHSSSQPSPTSVSGVPSPAIVIPVEQLLVLFVGHQTRVFKDLIARESEAERITTIDTATNKATHLPPERNCLSLVTPTRTIDLECASGEDRDAWLVAFQYLLNHTRSGAHKSVASINGVNQLHSTALDDTHASSDESLHSVIANLKSHLSLAAPTSSSVSPESTVTHLSPDTLLHSHRSVSHTHDSIVSSSSASSSLNSTPAFGSPIVSPAVNMRSLLPPTHSPPQIGRKTTKQQDESIRHMIQTSTSPLSMVRTILPPTIAEAVCPSARAAVQRGSATSLEPLIEKDDPDEETQSGLTHKDDDVDGVDDIGAVVENAPCSIVVDSAPCSLSVTPSPPILMNLTELSDSIFEVDLYPPSTSSTPPMKFEEDIAKTIIMMETHEDIPTDEMTPTLFKNNNTAETKQLKREGYQKEDGEKETALYREIDQSEVNRPSTLVLPDELPSLSGSVDSHPVSSFPPPVPPSRVLGEIHRLRRALHREAADHAHLRIWTAHRFMHLQSHINSLMIEQRKLLALKAEQEMEREKEFEREIQRVRGANNNRIHITNTNKRPRAKSATR